MEYQIAHRAMFVQILFLISIMHLQDYSTERHRMVYEQIEQRGVKDQQVLEAMRTVPRHAFVPEIYQYKAYDDYPLPIGYGQTISQPYIVAYMTEKLHLQKTHRVLEIGTGSGYQAAVLSLLADSVFTVEIVEPLGEQARERLQQMQYYNVKVKIGDGYQGWGEHAPYDAIIVTAAPETVPPPLIDQLKENGLMIIPIGSEHTIQQLLLLEKRNGKMSRKHLLTVRFVPFTREK